MSYGAELHAEAPINTDRQFLAGRCLAAQNLRGVPLRNSQLGMKVFNAKFGLHDRKFGYFEPHVKEKVRTWHNDTPAVSSHSSVMSKRKKLKAGDPGWYVREWLAFKGLRQKDLVSRTDWNKSQINEWVSGAERWNRDNLHAFAYAIGVEPADLLRPPPPLADPVDDEFSRFVVRLDREEKKRLLRLWEAVSDRKLA